MKRYSLFFISLVLLLALAPLPSAASGGGDGGGGERDRDEAQEDNTFGVYGASTFINAFFLAGSSVIWKNLAEKYQRQEAAEETQRLFVERVVAERARRNAERQAQEDEYYKRAENISDDDLPGLGPD